MQKLQYELVENTLTAEDFVRLKVATGFMDRLLEHIKSEAIPGTGVEVGLTAVKGKEPFYEKFGFTCGSSGMKKWIDIEC